MKKILLTDNILITDTEKDIRLSKSDRFKLLIHLHVIIKKIYTISEYKKVKWYHYFIIAPNVIFILKHLDLIIELNEKLDNIYQDEFEKITKLLARQNSIKVEDSEVFVKSILVKVEEAAIKLKEISTLFKNELFL